MVFTPTGEPIGSGWRVAWSGVGPTPALLGPNDQVETGRTSVLRPIHGAVTPAEHVSHTMLGVIDSDPALEDSALVIIRFPALCAYSLRAVAVGPAAAMAAPEHDSLSTVTFNHGPLPPLPPIITSASVSRTHAGLVCTLRGHELSRVVAGQLVYGVVGIRLPLTLVTQADSLVLTAPPTALPDSIRIELTTASGEVAAEDLAAPAPARASSAGQPILIIRFQAGEVEPPPGLPGGALNECWFADSATRTSLESTGVLRLDRLIPTFAHSDTNGVNLRGEPVRLIDLADIYVATFGSTPTSETTLALEAIESVRYACPSPTVRALQSIPSDPYFPDQWGLQNAGADTSICGRTPSPAADIDAPEAWDLTTGTNTVKIAILDSGLSLDSYEFDSGSDVRVVMGQDQVFCEPPTEGPIDDTQDRHGTAVAGILGASANNGYGGAGVTWNTLLYPLKVESGNLGSSPADLARAIDWARADSIPILAIGLGYPAVLPDELAYLNDVVYNAFQAGHFLAAPMGNKNRVEPIYPAAFAKRVCAVGATWLDGTRWQDSAIFEPSEDLGSNRGPWIDLAAPGGRMIVTPGVGNDYMYELGGCSNSTTNPELMGFGGTSAATPFVAGVAALLHSMPITPGAVLLGEDLEQIMKYTASQDGLWNEEIGYGIVKARRALNFVDPGSRLVLQGALGWGGTHGALNVVSQSDEPRTFFGVPGIPEGTQLLCQRYTLRGDVSFGSGFVQAPAVWARSSGTFGSRDSTVIDADLEVPWGRVVGEPSATSVTFETYVFQVPNYGWYPVSPGLSRIAFTAIGSSNLVGVPHELRPRTFELSIAPNPLTSACAVALKSPITVHSASVGLTTVSGRRVRNLVEGSIAAGAHVFMWDGLDDSGRRLPPGVYLFRARLDDHLMVRKLVVLAGHP